jgi:uncharacterized protein YggE
MRLTLKNNNDMKNQILLLVTAITMQFCAFGQNNKTISVLGEASGKLDPEYAIFQVVLTDADCSARFPDIQSKQRKYTEITKEYGIVAADNVLISESVKRVDNYEGAKDVHMVTYNLTVRKRESMLAIVSDLDGQIPGTRATIFEVVFGDNNAAREAILKQAYNDARHRAEVMAKQSGATLGQIIAIKEERYDEGGSVIERLFTADKMYKRDEIAAGYLQLFPEFSITVRLEFELITKP